MLFSGSSSWSRWLFGNFSQSLPQCLFDFRFDSVFDLIMILPWGLDFHSQMQSQNSGFRLGNSRWTRSETREMTLVETSTKARSKLDSRYSNAPAPVRIVAINRQGDMKEQILNHHVRQADLWFLSSSNKIIRIIRRNYHSRTLSDPYIQAKKRTSLLGEIIRIFCAYRLSYPEDLQAFSLWLQLSDRNIRQVFKEFSSFFQVLSEIIKRSAESKASISFLVLAAGEICIPASRR